jgi:TolB-like protein/Tfp pilus assembly protein PilF
VLTGPVFLSYSSEDGAAAERICTSLRAAGIEVWFDQSELRGGDIWEQSIRRQIKTCALFIPIISKSTHVRIEGYFRLEWKLAVDRSYLIASDQAFLVPVVIDDTGVDDERVPERFSEVQWTRLPGGTTTPVFVEWVRQLLSRTQASESIRAPRAAASRSSAARTSKPVRAVWWTNAVLLVMIATVIAALGYLVVNRFMPAKRLAVAGVPVPAVQAGTVPVAKFEPPPHSIAVLPFVNMSSDKEQDYFSDGLTEELLNSLTRINELQVCARTSSFFFKGKDADISTIARKLNVGAVLEGSVRRSANTIRITAQLINAVTGFHLWSQTYDRDLGDVLKLQTEIASAVAGALKVTLLGDVAAKVELGGTHSAAAFDSYLRGLKLFQTASSGDEFQAAIAAYTEAVRLDSNYALAFADRSIALANYSATFATGASIHEGIDQALADAHRSLELTSELGLGHLALANIFAGVYLDFAHANEEYERALALAPGDARILSSSSGFISRMGRADAAIAVARRAVTLDPLNFTSHSMLGAVLYDARRYTESITAYEAALALQPSPGAYAHRGLAYYALNDFARARASCEVAPDYWLSQLCLAITYDKLGRHADARAMWEKLKSAFGDAGAYQYAQIYAQWGDTNKALDWLETASRLRDSGLTVLKVDTLLDPLRSAARFQVIEKTLKFPT